MEAVFRCDAAPTIGGGHVVRCLSLADALSDEGWGCRFVSCIGTRDTVPALARSCHGYTELPPDQWDSPDALRSAASDRCDLLIIDHYGLDAAYEHWSREWADRLLVIEDLEDRDHDCDVIVDATPGRTASDYRTRSAPETRLLLGPDYVLLRRAFSNIRDAALTRRRADGDVARVFVGFGAVDGKNMIPVALRGLADAGFEGTVDVVIGSEAEGIGSVRAKVASIDLDITVHVDPPDIASLMVCSDLAVGAAGTASWERCCLGLPSVIVVTADNQRAIADALSNADAAVFVGCWTDVAPSDVAAAVTSLIGDRLRRTRMTMNAAAMCDGNGARRILSALAGIC